MFHNRPPARPWVRFFARNIDNYLFAFFLGLLWGFFLPSYVPKSDKYAKFQEEVFSCFGDTSLAYNSISPNFKKRCCSKGVRREVSSYAMQIFVNDGICNQKIAPMDFFA